MSIHQQATIPADPEQVYQVLADARALSALSGMGGRTARAAGEEFAAFDGNVTGRQIELVPGIRIVQAWRFPRWEPGQYSLVTFTLAATGGGTSLSTDQHGEPEDWRDHLEVPAASHPNVVVWEVTSSPLVPDWAGTQPTFTMTATEDGCRLNFTHYGLVPALECYEMCNVDWGRFPDTPRHPR